MSTSHRKIHTRIRSGRVHHDPTAELPATPTEVVHPPGKEKQQQRHQPCPPTPANTGDQQPAATTGKRGVVGYRRQKCIDPATALFQLNASSIGGDPGADDKWEARNRRCVRGGMLRECGDGYLDPESDVGPVEYKWRLVDISDTRLAHLETQMRFRVAEGKGECIYELGVEDDGCLRGLCDSDFEASLTTIRRMADHAGYHVQPLFERTVATQPSRLRCAELRIQDAPRRPRPVTVAFLGATGAGKSTLVGVLANGTPDDGSGRARQSVLNHLHELSSGRTSSVGRQPLAFDAEGAVLNYDEGGRIGTAEGNEGSKLLVKASSLVAMMDLPGDNRHARTTRRALLSRSPDVACLVLSAIAPDMAQAERDLARVAALNKPFFVVFTHYDAVPSPATMVRMVMQLTATARLSFPNLQLIDVRAQPQARPRTPTTAPPRVASGFLDLDFDDEEPDEDDPHAEEDDDADLFGFDSDNSDSDSMPPPPATADHPMSWDLRSRAPIFSVSAVSGDGFPELRSFLAWVSTSTLRRAPIGDVSPASDGAACFGSPQPLRFTAAAAADDDDQHPPPTLPPIKSVVMREPEPDEARPAARPARVLVHRIMVKDGRTVVLGAVVEGCVRRGATLLLGPVGAGGDYFPATVDSIQLDGLFAASATSGDDAAFAIDGPAADLDVLDVSSSATAVANRGLVLIRGPPTSVDRAVEARIHVPAAPGGQPAQTLGLVEGRAITLHSEHLVQHWHVLAVDSSCPGADGSIHVVVGCASVRGATPVPLRMGAPVTLVVHSGTLAAAEVHGVVQDAASHGEVQARHADVSGRSALLGQSPDSAHVAKSPRSAGASATTVSSGDVESRPVAKAAMPTGCAKVTERPLRHGKRKELHRCL